MRRRRSVPAAIALRGETPALGDFRYGDRAVTLAEQNAFDGRRDARGVVALDAAARVLLRYFTGDRLGLTLMGTSHSADVHVERCVRTTINSHVEPCSVAAAQGAAVGDVLVCVNGISVAPEATVHEVGRTIRAQQRRTGGVFTLVLRRPLARSALVGPRAAVAPRAAPDAEAALSLKLQLELRDRRDAARVHTQRANEQASALLAARRRIGVLEREAPRAARLQAAHAREVAERDAAHRVALAQAARAKGATAPPCAPSARRGAGARRPGRRRRRRP